MKKLEMFFPEKPNNNNIVKIHSLSHDGRGIATINQKTTFISGSLPEEIVSYQITHRHRHYNEAKVLELLEPSAKRFTPPCPHFNICGGCSLQHLEMNTQLEFKQQTLLDHLKHLAQVTPKTILPVLSADTLGYRRKARLGVKFVRKKNKLLLGFREKSSRFLADLEQCLTLHPRIGKNFQALRELINSLTIDQQIPQVEIAMGDEQIAFVFRCLSDPAEIDIKNLIDFGKKFNIEIYLQPNKPQILEKIWPEDSNQRLLYSLPDHQLNFLFHPLDFTQINLSANRLMINQVLQLLELNSDDILLDLFCGIGNFTLPIARRVQHVCGIEGNEEMVSRAKENAHYNQLNNAEFYVANLEKLTSEEIWLKKPYNKILLDPPRSGAKSILPFLKNLSPQRIMYISCHSATLARDAKILVQNDQYQLTQVGIINMFPHTAHIEAMAVFDKNKEPYERT